MNDPARNPYAPSNVRDSGSLSSTIPQTVVRTGQVITFALVMGITFVGAILVYLTLNDGNPADESPLLPTIGCAVGIATWIGALFCPPIFRRQGRSEFAATVDRRTLSPEHDGAHSSSMHKFAVSENWATLIGQGLLDGGAMVNLILMMIDQWLLLHLSFAAAAIIGIASMTPTTTRLRHAIEQAKL